LQITVTGMVFSNTIPILFILTKNTIMKAIRKDVETNDSQGIYFYVYAVVISLAVILTVLTA